MHLCLSDSCPSPSLPSLLPAFALACWRCSIMEMNPSAEAFQRIFKNPFAFTAFKSTEPHLAGKLLHSSSRLTSGAVGLAHFGC